MRISFPPLQVFIENTKIQFFIIRKAHSVMSSRFSFAASMALCAKHPSMMPRNLEVVIGDVPLKSHTLRRFFTH